MHIYNLGTLVKKNYCVCQAIILVGMEEEEIDLFIKRLEKVFQKARQTELSQQSAQGSKFRSPHF